MPIYPFRRDISAFFISAFLKLFSAGRNGFSAFVKRLSKKLDTKLDTKNKRFSAIFQTLSGSCLTFICSVSNI